MGTLIVIKIVKKVVWILVYTWGDRKGDKMAIKLIVLLLIKSGD